MRALIDKPELETLDYKPTNTPEEAIDKLLPIPEQPASASPATLGMNSHVIKPEVRVNKAKDAGQHFQESLCREAEGAEQPNLPGREHHKDCECGNCPEQPNLKIIGEIEGLISQVNDKLCKITTLSGEGRLTVRRTQLKGQALEEIDLFQKTTLHSLRKAFED
ncbi:hypothetical protein LCGC14_2574540 [marine sediment metagenome]|uniref:Uncharacterized protein n=1 Tax=marine sediment metagenome TaxID=412755 RepID=A0A0F9AG98_9ZZZZ